MKYFVNFSDIAANNEIEGKMLGSAFLNDGSLLIS